MGSVARLIVASAFVGLGFALVPNRASADCSGEATCIHQMVVQTGTNASGVWVIYDKANEQLSSAFGTSGSWSMQRDVYPYSDTGGYGGGAGCTSHNDYEYNQGGYGLTAHYKLQATVQATKCDSTTAFNHTHPSTWYTVYWYGQTINCYSNEQGGWNGTC